MITNSSKAKINLSFLPSLILIILIIGITVVFNLSIVDVRFQELDKSLYEVAYQQDINKSLNMLAKYSIIKRRMERGSVDVEDYAIESKVMAVLASDLLKDETTKKLNPYNYIYPVVRFGMNIMRFLMGKDLVSETERRRDDKELEIAYFYERNRRYDKALEIYNSILETKKHSPGIESYIILHKGFCESMYGNIDKARKSYEKLINEYSDSEAAIVAWKLLEFLNRLDDELDKTRKQRRISLSYGKKLYMLMDYKNAITIFTRLINQTRNKRALAEAYFFRGRCYEELGETSQALKNYKIVLNDYSWSNWSKDANRRIYILGEFYERDKEITNIALNRLKKFRDEKFFNELDSYSEIIQESKVSAELRLKQRKKVKKALKQKDADVLDIIENLDLSGEKAVERELDSLKKAAELRKRRKNDNVKDKPNVNSHPLRNPSFISREIQKRSRPLKSIYNLMLKSGNDFSGTVKVTFYIHSSGKTFNIKVNTNSSLKDKVFYKRLVSQIKRWKFPSIDKKYPPLKVTYPFVFRKKE